PSVASTAITEPTGVDWPSGTAIFATVPSSYAVISIVALSVSTSAITSPEATLSPSLTFHLMMVPASIVSERRGMVMEMGMGEWYGSARDPADGLKAVCRITNHAL